MNKVAFCKKIMIYPSLCILFFNEPLQHTKGNGWKLLLMKEPRLYCNAGFILIFSSLNFLQQKHPPSILKWFKDWCIYLQMKCSFRTRKKKERHLFSLINPLSPNHFQKRSDERKHCVILLWSGLLSVIRVVTRSLRLNSLHFSSCWETDKTFLELEKQQHLFTDKLETELYFCC